MRPVVIALVAMLLAGPAFAESCFWPEWERFAERYVDNGRVVDGSDARQITTSEGQSYALFFALVAGDRLRFQQLLDWTSDHLAGGDMARRLPAWLWGNGVGGAGVIDANSASDSDLWVAYSLGEAGRLWSNHEYRTLAFFMAKLIARREVIHTDSYGPVLLPAPYGFVGEEGGIRLNPSYLAPQLLRRMASLYPSSLWPQVEASAYRLLVDSAPHGLSPDWFELRGDNILPDPEKGDWGSYDAIRVYLWLGMLPGDFPQRNQLLKHFSPMAELTEEIGVPPRRVNIAGKRWEGDGPWGFSAALIPLLRTSGMDPLAAAQVDRVTAAMSRSRGRDNYYNAVLSLFAMGWEQTRYKFGPEGQLEVSKGGCG